MKVQCVENEHVFGLAACNLRFKKLVGFVCHVLPLFDIFTW